MARLLSEYPRFFVAIVAALVALVVISAMVGGALAGDGESAPRVDTASVDRARLREQDRRLSAARDEVDALKRRIEKALAARKRDLASLRQRARRAESRLKQQGKTRRKGKGKARGKDPFTQLRKRLKPR